MTETPNIGITPGAYSLVGATLSLDGQFHPEILAAQQELNRLGYNTPVDGVGGTGDHSSFLNQLYAAQNAQSKTGIATMGQQAWGDYMRNNLRGGQNTAPGQTPPAGTPEANANLAGQLGSLNPQSTTSTTTTPPTTSTTSPQGATPTTNNGVENSVSGNQGQTGTSLGNISQQMTPQDQQRQAIGTDPNNITGYQNNNQVQ